MPSKLGKYKLHKTLGTGAFSMVKLGVDEATGQAFAIKVHKTESSKFD